MTKSVYPGEARILRPEILPLNASGSSENGFVAMKTHEFVDSRHDDFPAIVIYRDGRSACVSHAHFLLDFCGVASPYIQVLQSLVTSGEWSSFHKRWLSRERVKTIRFEEMVSTPERGISLIEEAMKSLYDDAAPTPFEHTSARSFRELHDLDNKFFRRGIVDSWRDEMPADVEDLFWNKNGEMMEGLGYAR
jgi:hypothetical protein